MQQTKTYDCFPMWIVGVSNLVAVSVYGLGAYILSGFGLWLSGLYLLYCLGLELRLLKGHCVNCYYYGKVAAWVRANSAHGCSKKAIPANLTHRPSRGPACYRISWSWWGRFWVGSSCCSRMLPGYSLERWPS